ncbi:hypothetical protein QP176_14940 [Sphingomonas aerolata]
MMWTARGLSAMTSLRNRTSICGVVCPLIPRSTTPFENNAASAWIQLSVIEIAHEHDADHLAGERAIIRRVTAQLAKIAGQHMPFPCCPAGCIGRCRMLRAGVSDDTHRIAGIGRVCVTRLRGDGDWQHTKYHWQEPVFHRHAVDPFLCPTSPSTGAII